MYDIGPTLDFVMNLLSTTGTLKWVSIGMPKAPPDGLGLAIEILDLSDPEVTLDSTIEVYNLLFRFFRVAYVEPLSAIEIGLQHAVAEVKGLLAGHFTAGGRVRAIGWAGEEGARMTARWGHLEVSGTVYRVVDLTVPLIVDDSAEFTA